MTTNATKRHIAVSLDGTERDGRVVAEAARLAADLGARVTLLRVIQPPRRGLPLLPSDLLPAIDLAEGQTEAELRAYDAAFAGLPVTRHVLVGKRLAEEIVRWLRANSVDFVVSAREEAGWFRWPFTHNVSETIQRSGLASVVAVGASQPQAPQPSLAAAAGA